MAGSEFEHVAAGGEGPRVERYRRTLREVADHRAVDEAEDVLARAWLAQLDEMRRAALSLVAAARMASNAARVEVNRAAEQGGPAALALAQAKLRSIEAAQEGNVREAREFLASLDAELELVCQAGAERARRDHADHARLRAAWEEAFGGGNGGGDGNGGAGDGGGAVGGSDPGSGLGGEREWRPESEE